MASDNLPESRSGRIGPDDLSRLIVDTVHDAESWLSPEGRLLWVNRVIERLTGHTPEACLAMADYPLGLIHEDDRPTMLALIDEARREREETDATMRVVCKDGHVMWAKVFVCPIGAEDGSLRGLRLSVRDVSERRHSEELQRRLAMAIEQAAESIVITDCNGVIEYVNPAFEAMTGFVSEEAVGSTPSFLKTGRPDDSFFRELVLRLGSGEVWRGRFTNKRKDGAPYELEAVISPVRDGRGRVVNFVSVARDVTAETRLKNRLSHAHKMEALATLAGGVAHDFKNLLFLIEGWATMAMKELEPGAKPWDCLQRILRIQERAGELVRHILTFSRLEEGERRPIQIQALLSEALRLFRASLPENVELTSEIDDGVGPILADPSQIHQVFINLCANAGYAMRERGGVLSVTLFEKVLDLQDAALQLDLSPGRYVILSVEDTGCGMEEALITRIFEPYFTTKDASEGTGLGLATVHGIVRGYGGVIRVSSKPGQGTRFDLYFPAHEAHASDVESAPDRLMGVERIMMIGADQTAMNALKRHIESYGYRVALFSSTLEALRAFGLAPEEFGAVLVDEAMPFLTGAQLAREICAIRPGIPIILCCGPQDSADEPSRGEGLRNGVCELVRKPVTTEKLLQALRRAIDA